MSIRSGRRGTTRRSVVAMVVTLAVAGVPAPGVHASSAEPSPAWTRQFGSRAYERVFATAADSAGSSYTVGGTRGTLTGQTRVGCEDPFLVKVTHDGQWAWARQFGTARDDVATAVAVDPKGNSYVLGQLAQTDISARSDCQGEPADVFVRSYSPAGALLWRVEFGTADANDYLGGGVVQGDTLFVVGSRSTLTASETFLRRYSLTGTYLGETTLGATGSCQVIVTADALGLYVADSACGDVVVRKFPLDGSAKALWKRVLNSGADEQAHGLAVGGDALYVAGFTRGVLATGGPTAGDAFTARLGTSDGHVQWVLQQGPDHGAAWDVAAAADQGAYVTGSVPVVTPRGVSSDAFVWRLGAGGDTAWVHTSSLSTSGHDAGRGVAVHRDGGFEHVRVAGETSGALCSRCHLGGMDGFVVSYLFTGG